MNRVAIDLGFVQIYWYSIFIILGMAFGMYLILKETRRKHYDEDLVASMIFNTVIVAIIGARLYYVLFNLDYYSNHIVEIFEVWNGGLAIHGGIIAGALYLAYFTKKHNFSTLKMMDICTVGLLIGQVFGRWGNFFNSEAYGGVVSRTFLENLHLPNFIIEGMYIDGAYHHPTFLYESVWNLIGFGLIFIFRRFKYVKEGQITGFYLMWYSLGRFYIEGMRTDSLMFGHFRMAQIVSVILFLIGFSLIIFRMRTSKFEYLYNSESDDNGK